jgi:hypothetical protein
MFVFVDELYAHANGLGTMINFPEYEGPSRKGESVSFRGGVLAMGGPQENDGVGAVWFLPYPPNAPNLAILAEVVPHDPTLREFGRKVDLTDDLNFMAVMAQDKVFIYRS